MSEITWRVTQCDRYTNHAESGNDDVIFNLHWDCVAVEGGHTARHYGSLSLNLDDLSDFTSYADVTEEQVMGWLQDGLGEEGTQITEEAVQSALDNLLTPPVLNGVPWGNESGEEEEG